MRKLTNRVLCTALIAGILTGAAALPAKADAVPGEDTKYERYISFGADLKPGEKTSVLNIFGVTEAGLADYKTIEVTNKD